MSHSSAIHSESRSRISTDWLLSQLSLRISRKVEDEFEWLGSLKDFEHVIPLDDHSIIVVAGCGNSRLSQGMDSSGSVK